MVAGLEKICESTVVSKFDIEKLVHRLENLRDSSGSVKFTFLSAFMKCVLSFSHGNSAPESGFSINKHILDIHAHSPKEDTIEPLRVVKDAILRYPSLLDFRVTKKMLQNVKASRQRYQADLEAKRLLLEREAAKKGEEEQRRKELERQDELKKEHSKELETVKTVQSQTENGICIANDSVDEGNREFKELLSKKNATRKDLQRAQSKIEMGIKRRAELLTEETILKKRLKELEEGN